MNKLSYYSKNGGVIYLIREIIIILNYNNYNKSNNLLLLK